MARGPSQWLFHQVTYRNYEYTPDSGIRSVAADDESTQRFIERFGGRLDFAGRSVLDVGCGLGSMCAEAVRGGAERVVGVDLDVARAETRIAEQVPDLAGRVSLIETGGRLEELDGQAFDLVISKDSMEHYADPESFVHLMTRHLGPGGSLVIGFSPLWKSPKGGHIDFMTPLPWAQLLFPEATIMAERRRFRPDEDARSFGEIKGGLNKMTLKRFRAVMAGTGLEPVFFETNVSRNPAVRAMKVLSRLRPVREYFTQSVYSIWRRPDA